MMPRSPRPSFLFYIPNTVEPGHRGDDTVEGWGSLEYSVELALAGEAHGWEGALLGTGWGRPDTFTVATALAARTTTFKPLVAVRPGHWQPAQFASAAATLDRLSAGRLLVNIVSGVDSPEAYGDTVVESSQRYDRTLEFLTLIRRLWSESEVTFAGEYYSVANASLGVAPVMWRTAGIRASTSEGPHRRPSASQPPAQTSSCFGASRSTGWPNASGAWPR